MLELIGQVLVLVAIRFGFKKNYELAYIIMLVAIIILEVVR